MLDNNYVLFDAGDQEDVVGASYAPKFDMHLYTSDLDEANVRWIAQSYGIPIELHPHSKPEGMTILDVPEDAIELYLHYFKQGGFRIPTSTFFLRVLKYFRVHVSQLVPIGIKQTTMFEMYCRALDFKPTVLFFRVLIVEKSRYLCHGVIKIQMSRTLLHHPVLMMKIRWQSFVRWSSRSISHIPLYSMLQGLAPFGDMPDINVLKGPGETIICLFYIIYTSSSKLTSSVLRSFFVCL